MTASEAIRLSRALRTARRRWWEHMFAYRGAPKSLRAWALEAGVEPDGDDAEAMWESDNGCAERAVMARISAGERYPRVRSGRRWDAYVETAKKLEDEVRRVRDEMVRSTMPLAIYLTRGASSDDDVFQGAYEGLVIAVDRFRPELGHRFSTYARFWIRHGASKAMRERPVVCVREKQAQHHKKILEAAEVTSDPDQIAEMSSCSVDDVKTVLGSPRIRVPAVALMDPSPSAEEVVLGREVAQAVRDSVESLPARGRTILHKRYLNGRKVPLVELGKELGCSREWVRRIEQEARYLVGRAMAECGLAP